MTLFGGLTCPDSDDELLVESALATGASHIVAFNIHDLSAAESLGIKVVNPANGSLN